MCSYVSSYCGYPYNCCYCCCCCRPYYYGCGYGWGTRPRSRSKCSSNCAPSHSTADTTMIARVLEVRPDSLLVTDQCNHQQVQVNTTDACCYCVGDCLCIYYNGIMTASLPPQISATCICRL